uniref:Acyl-coenzyme A thioesterase 1-like n=1 Tax=Neogobius melanostomus TaxID=47308 RepID=A0A8C6UIS3_9GOBI
MAFPVSRLLIARCMFDDPLQIRVTGLSSRQDVVLRASATDERGSNFSSWAEFRADHSGQVDLSRDAPLSGSYSGVQPMGLLWSLSPEVPHRKFFKNQALSPHVVSFSVVDKQDGQILAQETNERCILGDGVQRQTVTEQGFTGVLFTPPGLLRAVSRGARPPLLPSEKRAGLLANKGFVVMTVPVFTGKPDQTERLHLDQYEAAVQYLLQHSQVGSAEVGVVALSKGADMALSLAAFVQGVGAVVWINGCSANAGLPLFYKQQQILPALRADLSKCIALSSDLYMVKNAMPIPTSAEHSNTVVPIEKASAQFLFVASEDDQNWDSMAFMEQMVERMKRHGRNNFEVISYPRAGHLLDTPFSPFEVSAFHGFGKRAVLWGGEPEAHARAEVQLWKKIQEFFRKHLKCDITRQLYVYPL